MKGREIIRMAIVTERAMARDVGRKKLAGGGNISGVCIEFGRIFLQF